MMAAIERPRAPGLGGWPDCWLRLPLPRARKRVPAPAPSPAGAGEGWGEGPQKNLWWRDLRASIPIVHNGFIPSINNSVAIGFCFTFRVGWPYASIGASFFL